MAAEKKLYLVKWEGSDLLIRATTQAQVRNHLIKDASIAIAEPEEIVAFYEAGGKAEEASGE